jgi:zinc protease
MRTLLCILSAALLLVLAGPAGAQESEVSEFTLDNGMKVILKENHNAPVINLNVAYRVGSKYERPGITGISHLLEHIMFKTTTKHPLGHFDQVLQQVGADNNANTWLDRTIYWETIASSEVDKALELEAERMRELAFIPEDHTLEMPVVRNELEQRNDSPETLLYEELLSFAFKSHPYQIPTIGWVDDVEGITTQDIKEFYDRWYHPDNAIFLAVGDFDTQEMLAKVKKYFGPIPKGNIVYPRLPVEGEQRGERRFELKRAGQVDYVMMGWHVPESEHPDSYALVVLGQVLGGGRTSRLYRALVDGGTAADIWAGSEAFDYADPFMFFAGATMNPGVPPAQAEEQIYAQIEAVKTGGVTDEELARAKKQSRASFVFARDSIVSEASNLLDFELYSGGWRNLYKYLPGIEAVTAADVQRVAQTYLTQDNRTVGYYLGQREQAGGPAGGAGGADARFDMPQPPQFKAEGKVDAPVNLTLAGMSAGPTASPTVAATGESGPYAHVFDGGRAREPRQPVGQPQRPGARRGDRRSGRQARRCGPDRGPARHRNAEVR